MTASSNNSNGPKRAAPENWDADAGQQLRELDAGDCVEDKELLQKAYDDLRVHIGKNDRTLRGFLRGQSTVARRLSVLVAFATVGVLVWQMIPVVEESVRTTQWGVTLAAYGALLLVTLFVATRPLHLPALPNWQSTCLICVVVGATLLAAFWPSGDAHAAAHGAAHADGALKFGSCMGMGLLFGLPVYAIVRLFDRGNTFGSLVAAAAAGLAGNMLLKMHCPVDSTSHVLLGHASVAVLFVVGLGLVHRWIPSK